MAAKNAGLHRALYRAMWRCTVSPAVRHSRFTLPDRLPDELAAHAARLGVGGHDQAGLQARVRAAWRAPPPAADERAGGDPLDEAFRALRALGELQGDLEEAIDERVGNADRVGIVHMGKLVAVGTNEELAAMGGQGNTALEDTFLALTQEESDVAVLRQLQQG